MLCSYINGTYSRSEWCLLALAADYVSKIMASVITDTGVTGLLYRNIQYGSCPVYIPLQLQCTNDFLDGHSLFKIGRMYVMARLRKGRYLTVARIQNIPREIMGAALK